MAPWINQRNQKGITNVTGACSTKIAFNTICPFLLCSINRHCDNKFHFNGEQYTYIILWITFFNSEYTSYFFKSEYTELNSGNCCTVEACSYYSWTPALCMDSACLASITMTKLRRVRIFGFKVESLSPNSQFINGCFTPWGVLST